ncbi:methyltransferase [Lasiosphaeria hispida]|uniref:Methyltransferase n=1 Tax=Lasiosphaeria hispida TaxID=260671 RepID=A0AAJ0MAC4_9PEZI|nr:methyltransferase [Lasiosphaeria hispida]
MASFLSMPSHLSQFLTKHLISPTYLGTRTYKSWQANMAPKSNWGAFWYNALTLQIYDAWVLGFNMSFVWRCTTETVLLPFFRENFSRRHLDIGVATGFFPATALAQQPPATLPAQEITLFDLNEIALRSAKARINADNQKTPVSVTTVHADALAGVPPELEGMRFDSVSLFNVLHCIPAHQERKNRVFELAADVLSDDGVVFGCSVLGIKHHAWWNPLGWMTMAFFNLVGSAFGNWEDEPAVFEQGLRREFEDVKTWIVGSVFLFRARKPKRIDR